MNEPFYTRGISVYLADFFQELVQGGKSDFEARALLIERLADFNHQVNTALAAGRVSAAAQQNRRGESPVPLQPARRRRSRRRGEAVPASDLDRAIKWLAAKLRQDRTATFAKYQAECMEKFGISERDYKSHVWPNAREEAGLEEGQGGPPKKK